MIEAKSICGSNNNSPAQNTPSAIALVKPNRRSTVVIKCVFGFELGMCVGLVSC